MDDPYPVEVDQKVGNRAFLIVGFKKDFIPVNMAEFHITLCRWDIDKTLLYVSISKDKEDKTETLHTRLLRTILARPSGYQKSWLTSS